MCLLVKLTCARDISDYHYTKVYFIHRYTISYEAPEVVFRKQSSSLTILQRHAYCPDAIRRFQLIHQVSDDERSVGITIAHNDGVGEITTSVVADAAAGVPRIDDGRK